MVLAAARAAMAARAAAVAGGKRDASSEDKSGLDASDGGFLHMRRVGRVRSIATYPLKGARGQMLLDLLVPAAHAAPEVGERVLCRHPFDSSKRAYVTPSRVLELHAPVFEGGRRVGASEDLRELRAYCQRQLGEVREDVLRPLNPTPYKTSVSAELFSFLQDALQRHQPITELT